MNASLELYRVFCRVAQTRSFSRAAEELFLSQPAVSQSVRRLEEQLGVQLITRSSKHVELTAEGVLLLEYAAPALGLIHSAEERLLRVHELSEGELRIGAGDSITKCVLLPCLETFHQRYPLVRLKIMNRTSAESLELLRAGQLDAALVNLPIADMRAQVHWQMPVHDLFVAGERFSELRGRTLTPRQLADKPLILLERKANSRMYIERFFLQRGVELVPEIELASYDLLLDLARIGLGISCVVEEFSARDLGAGALFALRLEPSPPPRSIGLIGPVGAPLAPPAARLLELLRGQRAD